MNDLVIGYNVYPAFPIPGRELATEFVEDVKLAVDPYVRKLAEMESAEEIKEFFEGEGIKAIPRNSRECPIAVYVRQESGHKVRATGACISAVCGKTPLSEYFPNSNSGATVEHWEVVAEVSDPMVTFMRRFDEGRYPKLVKS